LATSIFRAARLSLQAAWALKDIQAPRDLRYFQQTFAKVEGGLSGGEGGDSTAPDEGKFGGGRRGGFKLEAAIELTQRSGVVILLHATDDQGITFKLSTRSRSITPKTRPQDLSGGCLQIRPTPTE